MVNGKAGAGEESKKRIRVLVIAAMDGHMEQMIVINTTRFPRNFNAINKDLSSRSPFINWKWTSKSLHESHYLR